MTSEPIPELIAAAQPSPETPSTISGHALRECVADKPLLKTVTAADTGTYSPGLTYKFAERMQLTGKDGSIYAPYVRAYKVRVAGAGYFGQKIDSSFACYYELREGNLIYLTTLQGDRDGRVDIHEFNSAAFTAYRKMSGKSRQEILFGG